MSDQELKALIADLAKQHAKTETAQQRTEAAQQRTAAAQERTEAALQRTEETLRRVTRQLGGLGNKFGSFTEGLAFESMEKILRTRFHADNFARRAKPARGNFSQEYDLLGIRNGPHGEVYCVEIKSELNVQELEKSPKKFQAFFDVFTQYRGMKLYGIISAVDVRGALADRVQQEGLYLATASDENFKLVKPPRDFKPKVFTAK
ncbi:MAG: hypothetical protein HY674_22455 [Chloroflexi bacterium]|nr:hypothetical protein [Chloroflexota bacterium]